MGLSVSLKLNLSRRDVGLDEARKGKSHLHHPAKRARRGTLPRDRGGEGANVLMIKRSQREADSGPFKSGDTT